MTTEEIILYHAAKIEQIQGLIKSKTANVAKYTEGGRITSRELLSFAQSIAQLEEEEKISIEVRMALIQSLKN